MEQNDLVLGDPNLNMFSSGLEGVIASIVAVDINDSISQAKHSRMSAYSDNLDLTSANTQPGASGTGGVVMADSGETSINFTRDWLLNDLIDYSGPSSGCA